MPERSRSEPSPAGDADVAVVAGAIADPRRAAVLNALLDGRALAASVLASEAGVAASTASGHLARLRAAGLIDVEIHGRHRYYRLAGPEVAAVLEALARIAPAARVRSLREGTRAEMLRSARLCYDHVAGRLGVAVMGALIEREWLVGGDGAFSPANGDRLSAVGGDVPYELSGAGRTGLAELGVDVAPGGRRRLIRYCVDWSEQHHHLAGALGAALASRMLELDWIRRGQVGRALLVTDTGRAGLRARLGVEI